MFKIIVLFLTMYRVSVSATVLKWKKLGSQGFHHTPFFFLSWWRSCLGSMVPCVFVLPRGRHCHFCVLMYVDDAIDSLTVFFMSYIFYPTSDFLVWFGDLFTPKATSQIKSSCAQVLMLCVHIENVRCSSLRYSAQFIMDWGVAE